MLCHARVERPDAGREMLTGEDRCRVSHLWIRRQVLSCLAGAALARVVGATPAVAEGGSPRSSRSSALLAEKAFLSRLTQGEMAKFRFSEHPVQIVEASIRDAAGNDRSLPGPPGKLRLIAFWASWCAPCRTEVPSLDRLQAKLGDAGLEVVAASIDKSADVAKRALERWDVRHLPLHHDEGARAATSLGVEGVPMTLLLDPEGREIGRLRGTATWDVPESILLVQAVLSRLTDVKAFAPTIKQK